MVFFVPFRTHAYSERPPVGTRLLIAACVLIQLALANGLVELRTLALSWNDLGPVTLVTSTFVHGGWMHLVGNMILLWSLGRIVEGTIGTWRFLGVVVLLGVLQNLLELALFAGDRDTISFGSSAMLFGLLGAASIWAPRSTVETVTVFIVRIWILEVSITGLAAIMIGFELLYAALGLFEPSSSVLHLLGAAVGIPVAIALLKLDLVDCGGWDRFSLRQRESV